MGETMGLRVLSRDDLAVVAVRGDDARSWLNGQVTNDVRTTSPGGAVRALVLNVKGRILAEAVVIDRGDSGLAMIVPRSELEVLRSHLEKYVIMEDVELVLEDARVAQVEGGLPFGVEHYPAPWLGDAAALAVGDASLVRRLLDAGGSLEDEASSERARVRAGRPRFGPDFGGTSYPQEAGLDSAVSFQKGCYLGQEVVCMLENRGQLSRALARLRVDGSVDAGAAVEALDGSPLGALTSVAAEADHTLALGYVKRSAIAEGTHVRVGARSAVVLGRARG